MAIGLIAMSGMTFPVKSKIMTIDFSVNDSCDIRDASRKSPPAIQEKEEVVAKKVAHPAENISKPETKQEKIIERPSAQVPASSENQAPVMGQEQKRIEPAHTLKDTHEQAGRFASARNPSASAPGSSENGAEKREAVYIKESFTYIRDSVQKKMEYPKMARKMGWEGKVVLAFTILSDGNAKDVTVKESCGIDILNNSAVEAVKKASPFPKPPAEARIILPVVFKLN